MKMAKIMQGKHGRAKQECSTQDAEMELSMADKNWQTDAQWTNRLWNFAMQEMPITEMKGQIQSTRDTVHANDCDNGSKATDTDSEEDTEMEQEDNAQATWTEEERTIFKLKIKTSIPLIYHGPVFNKKYFDYLMRVFPVTYLDVCNPGFKTITSNASSVRLSLDQHLNVLELYTTRNAAKAVVEGILFAVFEDSLITVEVERRDPDWSKVEDGKPVFFPTLAHKATFKVNNAYMRQHLRNERAVDESASEQQRSLFLYNLPGNIYSPVVQVLFPLCLKCRMMQVSHSVWAAILQMQSVQMAFNHLVGITDFHINGRIIKMGTSHFSQHEAIQRTVETEGTALATPPNTQGPSVVNGMVPQAMATGPLATALVQADVQQTASQGLPGMSEQEPMRSLLGQSAEEGNHSCPATKELWGPESTPGQLFAQSNTHSKPAHVPDPHIFSQNQAGNLAASQSTAKHKRKRKCPSNVRRDKARRQRFEQRRRAQISSALQFPTSLSLMSAPSATENLPCVAAGNGYPSDQGSQCMEATAALAQKHGEADARGPSYKHHVPVQHLQWAVTGVAPATVSVGGSASVPASTGDPSLNWRQVNGTTALPAPTVLSPQQRSQRSTGDGCHRKGPSRLERERRRRIKFNQIKTAAKELHTEQMEEGGSILSSNSAVSASGISKNVEYLQVNGTTALPAHTVLSPQQRSQRSTGDGCRRKGPSRLERERRRRIKFNQIKTACKELHTEQTEEGGSILCSNSAVAAPGISKNVKYSQVNRTTALPAHTVLSPQQRSQRSTGDGCHRKGPSRLERERRRRIKFNQIKTACTELHTEQTEEGGSILSSNSAVSAPGIRKNIEYSQVNSTTALPAHTVLSPQHRSQHSTGDGCHRNRPSKKERDRKRMTKFIQIKLASKELHTEQTEEGGSIPNSNIAVAATGINKNVEHSQGADDQATHHGVQQLHQQSTHCSQTHLLQFRKQTQTQYPPKANQFQSTGQGGRPPQTNQFQPSEHVRPQRANQFRCSDQGNQHQHNWFRSSSEESHPQQTNWFTCPSEGSHPPPTHQEWPVNWFRSSSEEGQTQQTNRFTCPSEGSHPPPTHQEWPVNWFRSSSEEGQTQQTNRFTCPSEGSRPPPTHQEYRKTVQKTWFRSPSEESHPQQTNRFTCPSERSRPPPTHQEWPVQKNWFRSSNEESHPQQTNRFTCPSDRSRPPPTRQERPVQKNWFMSSNEESRPQQTNRFTCPSLPPTHQEWSVQKNLFRSSNEESHLQQTNRFTCPSEGSRPPPTHQEWSVQKNLFRSSNEESHLQQTNRFTCPSEGSRPPPTRQEWSVQKNWFRSSSDETNRFTCPSEGSRPPPTHQDWSVQQRSPRQQHNWRNSQEDGWYEMDRSQEWRKWPSRVAPDEEEVGHWPLSEGLYEDDALSVQHGGSFVRDRYGQEYQRFWQS